MYSVARE